MRYLLVAVIIAISGCAGLSSYQAQSTDDAIRIVEEAGGTGCFYHRATGNSRPYVDIEGVSMVISTLGKGTNYLECLQAIPEKERSVIPVGE